MLKYSVRRSDEEMERLGVGDQIFTKVLPFSKRGRGCVGQVKTKGASRRITPFPPINQQQPT